MTLLKDFSRAIELNPNFAEPYNNGNVYGIEVIMVKKGDYDLAIEDYNRAIGLNPNLANVYCNRGVAYGLQR